MNFCSSIIEPLSCLLNLIKNVLNFCSSFVNFIAFYRSISPRDAENQRKT